LQIRPRCSLLSGSEPPPILITFPLLSNPTFPKSAKTIATAAAPYPVPAHPASSADVCQGRRRRSFPQPFSLVAVMESLGRRRRIAPSILKRRLVAKVHHICHVLVHPHFTVLLVESVDFFIQFWSLLLASAWLN
jgi:hypothetical protein